MPAVSRFVTWFAIVLFTVTLALLLFVALPTGCVVQIGAHSVLLTGGAAIALLLRPRSGDDA